MRKHFLILMLLTLLPLAGFADDLREGKIVIASTYFGNAPTCTADNDATQIKVYNKVNVQLTKDVDFTFDGFFDDEACENLLTEDQVKGKNAGTTIWVKVTGKVAYEYSLTASFQIKQMPLELKGTPGSKTYGTAEDGDLFSFGAGSSIKTKFAVGADVLDLTDALKTKINFRRDSGEDAGTYDIHAAINTTTASAYAVNYTIADADVKTTANAAAKYTINKKGFVDAGADATVLITVTANLTYNGTAQKATVVVKDKASNQTLNEGSYYTADEAIAWNTAHAAEITADPTLVKSAESVKVAGDYYLTWANNTNASNTATVTVKGMCNYEAGTIAAKAFTIKAAPLIVTPSATKVYDRYVGLKNGFDDTDEDGQQDAGEDDTFVEITYAYQGFVDNKKAADVTVGTSACTVTDPSANVDTYELNITTNNFTLANYTFIPVKGEFKITKKAITFTAANKDDVSYGDNEVYALTNAWKDAALDADEDYLEYAVKITRATTKVGGTGDHKDDYYLTPSWKSDDEIDAEVDADNNIDADDKDDYKAAVKTAMANYNPTWTKGYATVNNAALQIALKESFYGKLEKVYDGQPIEIELDKEDGLYVFGKKNESDVIDLSGLTLTVTPNANNNTKDAGTYQLVLDGATAANYDITYIPSQYKITPRPLKLTVAKQTFVNGAVPTIAFLYTVEDIKVAGKSLAEQGIAETDAAKNVFKLQFTDAIETNATTGVIETDANDNIADAIEAALLPAAADNYDITTYAQTKGAARILANTTIMLDRASATLAATITANKGANKSVAFSSRPMYAETWQAYVLPFDVTPAQLCAGGLGYVIVNVLKPASTATNVKFGYTMKTIPAHTPFLMKTSEDTNMNVLTLSGVKIVEVPAANKIVAQNTAKDVNFYGIYATKVGPFAANEYVMYNATGDNNKWVNEYQGNLSAMSGYLVLPAGAEAPIITVEDEFGNTTAISQITADGRFVEADGWYTLNGVKLQGAPTQKGIYIRNGKKLVVK